MPLSCEWLSPGRSADFGREEGSPWRSLHLEPRSPNKRNKGRLLLKGVIYGSTRVGDMEGSLESCWLEPQLVLWLDLQWNIMEPLGRPWK